MIIIKLFEITYSAKKILARKTLANLALPNNPPKFPVQTLSHPNNVHSLKCNRTFNLQKNYTQIKLYSKHFTPLTLCVIPITYKAPLLPRKIPAHDGTTGTFWFTYNVQQKNSIYSYKWKAYLSFI